MTKQEKIEKLIQMEWEDFQKVNNEGGRASCQDDPETFFIMRRSHFAPWTEELIDCVQADMDRAHEQGRNLVMEKYAWMMASTAPEQFKKLHHFLIDPTLAGEQWSDAIVKQQLAWMEEYQAKYPVLASTVLKIRRMIRPSRRTCLENCGLTRTALCIRTGSLSMN